MRAISLAVVAVVVVVLTLSHRQSRVRGHRTGSNYSGGRGRAVAGLVCVFVGCLVVWLVGLFVD